MSQRAAAVTVEVRGQRSEVAGQFAAVQSRRVVTGKSYLLYFVKDLFCFSGCVSHRLTTISFVHRQFSPNRTDYKIGSIS